MKLLAIWNAVRRVSSSSKFALARIDWDNATKPFRNELAKEARSPESLQARLAVIRRRDERIEKAVQVKAERDEAAELLTLDL